MATKASRDSAPRPRVPEPASAPLVRRRRLRAVFAAALALGAAAGLGACVPRDEGQTLTFWAMGREGEVIAELMPEFERSHPGLHVQVQQLPWKSAHEKLLTAFVGRSTPDIAQLGNSWIAEFAELHALEPLDDAVATSHAIDRSDYFDGIWRSNLAQGRLYGIPWYVDTRLLFYRSDLLRRAGFDQPARSWPEWERQLAAVQRVAGPGNFAILMPVNEYEQLTSFGLQQDEPMLQAQGRAGNFDSPQFRSALAFYVGIFDRGWAPRVSETQISNVWDEFAKGYFSFYISGPWNIGNFRDRLPPERQGDWMTAPLPGPTGPGASIAGGSSLVLFRGTRHPREAWELIEFLSEPRNQEWFRLRTGDLPPRRTAWAQPALAADPYARAFRDQLERAQPVPALPEWERIEDEMRLVSSLAVNHQLTVDEAARELQRRTDLILAKRRWVLERRERGS